MDNIKPEAMNAARDALDRTGLRDVTVCWLVDKLSVSKGKNRAEGTAAEIIAIIEASTSEESMWRAFKNAGLTSTGLPGSPDSVDA